MSQRFYKLEETEQKKFLSIPSQAMRDQWDDPALVRHRQKHQMPVDMPP